MSDVFVPVELHIMVRGADVVVRDPPLRKVLELLRDAASVLTRLMNLPRDTDGLSVPQFAELLADPEIFKGFVLCASACTDKPPEFYSDISITDAVNLLEALVKTVDWRKLKELFLRMMPQLQQTQEMTT